MGNPLKEFLTTIRTVSDERSYWFVRTYSGNMFNEFFLEGYVGIGWNQIDLDTILSAASGDSNAREEVTTELSRHLKSKIPTGMWYNQLINFCYEAKEGDIIIIPSRYSSVYAIGEIKGTAIEVKSNRTFKYGNDYEPVPSKRRRVNWLKRVTDGTFKMNVGSKFTVRQTIANITPYRLNIEPMISDLFVFENQAHYLLRIRAHENINAYALRDYLDSLIFFYERILEDIGEPKNDELYIKIHVESPGKMRLMGNSVAGLIGLGLFVAASGPGKFEIVLPNGLGKFNAQTEGSLIKDISNAYIRIKDANIERQIRLMEAQQELGVTGQDNVIDEAEKKIEERSTLDN